MKENNYKKYSSYLYNQTKPPGTSVDGDLEFYKNLLMPIDGKVLEAGVGNGRLLIPFLKYKINIVGIDKSAEMLELCNQNLKQNNLASDLIQLDLLDYVADEEYDYIIMPNASFCLIENLTNAKQVLNNFYASLKNGGNLALDLIFPIEFKAGATHEYTHVLKDFALTVKNYSKAIDWVDQFTINEVEYLVDGRVQEKQIVKLSWYGINEFKMMLAQTGFKNINVIINYGNQKIINVKTVTFICEK